MTTTIRAIAVLAMTWGAVLPGVADTPRDETAKKIAALDWTKGPTTVTIAGNSKLTVPVGYLFLDRANTKKFDELNENLSDGQEVMIAPESGDWSAYLEFDDGGYVKDDEKIDGTALLKTLQQNTEAANAERQKRGWATLHVTGWAAPPAYNSDTKRLEWATVLASQGHENVNFFTKLLGRRGHTSVVMVSSTAGLADAKATLNKVLDGYSFDPGQTYAEWKPGDKVAEYGLAALVLGGAAAVAAKKGLWGVLAGFLAAAWKAIAAAAVGAVAWLRARFAKKSDAGR